ncbi:MAG: hypothetical protein HC858_00315, partial [Brachymonas sp.]|nr:hypothetical protein [Brachymonas sp.]
MRQVFVVAATGRDMRPMLPARARRLVRLMAGTLSTEHLEPSAPAMLIVQLTLEEALNAPSIRVNKLTLPTRGRVKETQRR